MKYVIYIPLILLSACRFDPGVEPRTQKSSDVIDTRPDKKDMSRDTKTTKPDLPLTDLGRDVSVKNDTSTDMSPKDVTTDIQSDPDMGSMCNGVPVDLKNDTQNCGRCDNKCDQDFANCNDGKCACPENAEPCGADNKCTDTKNDPLNCGGCGITCGASAECVNNACVCRDGYRDCNGKCVNLRSDPLNCGDCDKVCNGDDACNRGSCANSCFGGGWSCDLQTGQTYCGTRPDNFTCNARASLNCGTECGVGETCLRNTGLSTTYRCRQNRPTIGCNACPCVECADNEDCVVSEFAGNEIFCVEK